jgi:ABC-type multidrug transport system ATPase subunit
MIELKEVAKRFRIAPGPGRKAGVIDALTGVNARIDAGEVVAIVGPNGAGKSTLFAVLLGFLEPSAGDLSIEGQEPRAYVRARGAGYLPERFRLPAEWRVRHALRAFADLERASRARADDMIDAFGLKDDADKTIGSLSHGMVQRVGLAQALLAERALIVLDEPTEGLDAFWRVRFRDVFTQLRARQTTVLIASHDLAELERLADRAILIQNGSVTDTISLRDRTDSRAYRVVLADHHDSFAEVFPNATQAAEPHTFVVGVSDVADLNRRLAALLAAGGAVVTVQPADTLEERVTRGTGGRA